MTGQNDRKIPDMLSFKEEDRGKIPSGEPDRGDGLKTVLFRSLLMIFLGAAIQISFSNILTYILEASGRAEEYEQIVSPLLSMEPSMIFRVGFLAPVTEELLFRGGVFFLLRWNVSMLAGVLFGGITNPGYSWEAFRLSFLRNQREAELSSPDGIRQTQNQGDGELNIKTDTDRPLLRRRRAVNLTANLLQAAVFGLYHGNIYQGCYAFLIGVMFGSIALSCHTIIYGMIAHSSINLFGLYMDQIIQGEILPPAEFVLTVGSLFVIAWIMYHILRQKRKQPG